MKSRRPFDGPSTRVTAMAAVWLYIIGRTRLLTIVGAALFNITLSAKAELDTPRPFGLCPDHLKVERERTVILLMGADPLDKNLCLRTINGRVDKNILDFWGFNKTYPTDNATEIRSEILKVLLGPPGTSGSWSQLQSGSQGLWRMRRYDLVRELDEQVMIRGKLYNTVKVHLSMDGRSLFRVWFDKILHTRVKGEGTTDKTYTYSTTKIEEIQ